VVVAGRWEQECVVEGSCGGEGVGQDEGEVRYVQYCTAGGLGCGFRCW
jgi:hypothetical protein